MKKFLTTLIIGFAVIALFDTVGSISSRLLNFNYGNLSLISIIIYTVIPFLIAKRAGMKSAIIAGGLLGLFDVTVGLRLSMSLKANTGDYDMHAMTTLVYIVLVIFMTLLGSIFGLFGYLISKSP
jgi:heme/copper-type cytochrome/quinol oxidase subunit 4